MRYAVAVQWHSNRKRALKGVAVWRSSLKEHNHYLHNTSPWWKSAYSQTHGRIPSNLHSDWMFQFYLDKYIVFLQKGSQLHFGGLKERSHYTIDHTISTTILKPYQLLQPCWPSTVSRGWNQVTWWLVKGSELIFFVTFLALMASLSLGLPRLSKQNDAYVWNLKSDAIVQPEQLTIDLSFQTCCTENFDATTWSHSMYDLSLIHISEPTRPY